MIFVVESVTVVGIYKKFNREFLHVLGNVPLQVK